VQVVIREPDPEGMPGVHLSLDDLARHPAFSLHSNALCRAFYELYIGESSVAPAVRAAVAHGAAKLLDGERISSEYSKRSIFTERLK
jgi:hypothetical protein